MIVGTNQTIFSKNISNKNDANKAEKLFYELISKSGISVLVHEESKIKIKNKDYFDEINVKDLSLNNEIIFFFQNDIPLLNRKVKDIEKCYILQHILENAKFIKEDLFSLEINNYEVDLFSKYLNPISIEESSSITTLKFSSKNKFKNTLDNLKNKKAVIPFEVKTSDEKLHYFIEGIISKKINVKTHTVELFFKRKIIKEIQVFLLKYNIKSRKRGKVLIIKEPHSLLRLLNYFKINKNKQRFLQKLCSKIEDKYLYVGSNNTYFSSEIIQINKVYTKNYKEIKSDITNINGVDILN